MKSRPTTLLPGLPDPTPPDAEITGLRPSAPAVARINHPWGRGRNRSGPRNCPGGLAPREAASVGLCGPFRERMGVRKKCSALASRDRKPPGRALTGNQGKVPVFCSRPRTPLGAAARGHYAIVGRENSIFASTKDVRYWAPLHWHGLAGRAGICSGYQVFVLGIFELGPFIRVPEWERNRNGLAFRERGRGIQFRKRFRFLPGVVSEPRAIFEDPGQETPGQRPGGIVNSQFAP